MPRSRQFRQGGSRSKALAFFFVCVFNNQLILRKPIPQQTKKAIMDPPAKGHINMCHCRLKCCSALTLFSFYTMQGSEMQDGQVIKKCLENQVFSNQD